MSLHSDNQFIHLIPSVDFEEQRRFRQGTQAAEVIEKNQASWYCSSWRGLQSDASTPDDSRLITPETTPPSFPTNFATAPRRWTEQEKLRIVEERYPSAKYRLA